MRNIGIDISKRKCIVCVMDDKGRILEETAYDNTLEDAKELEPDSADKLCMDILIRTARFAKNTCRYKEGVLVAIDKHLIPRHNVDNMSHLVRSKPKGGTGKFECYATMQS